MFSRNVDLLCYGANCTTGWVVAEKEEGGSTFGDHLGREHFKHHLEQRLDDRLEDQLGDHLGDQLGDQLGDHLVLQPLPQFQQNILPPPHLDLTLVSYQYPQHFRFFRNSIFPVAKKGFCVRHMRKTKQQHYPLLLLSKNDLPSRVLSEPFGSRRADNFFQYFLPSKYSWTDRNNGKINDK